MCPLFEKETVVFLVFLRNRREILEIIPLSRQTYDSERWIYHDHLEGDSGKIMVSRQLSNENYTIRSASPQEIEEERNGSPVKSSSTKTMSFPTETRAIMRFSVMPLIHWAMGDTLGSINHKKISLGGDLLSVFWRTVLGEKNDAKLPSVVARKENLLQQSGFAILTNTTPSGKNPRFSPSTWITHDVSRSVFYLIIHPNATQLFLQTEGTLFSVITIWPPAMFLSNTS